MNRADLNATADVIVILLLQFKRRTKEITTGVKIRPVFIRFARCPGIGPIVPRAKITDFFSR